MQCKESPPRFPLHLPGYIMQGPRTHLYILQLFWLLAGGKEMRKFKRKKMKKERVYKSVEMSWKVAKGWKWPAFRERRRLIEMLYLCPCSVFCHCHGAPEPHRCLWKHRWELQPWRDLNHTRRLVLHTASCIRDLTAAFKYNYTKTSCSLNYNSSVQNETFSLQTFCSLRSEGNT